MSAALARDLAAEGEAHGFSFVDAPVSGGQAGAENGKLSIMCGGSDEAFARAALDMGEQTCFLHAFCRTDLKARVRITRV